MKMLSLLSLALLSQVAFARVLPDEEATVVMDAIIEAAQESSITCKTTNAQGEVTETLPIANSFNWAAFPISENYFTQMLVDEEAENPVITIRRKYPDATFVEETMVTTSADMTEVIGFNYKRFDVVAGKKNTGTILRPNFVETKELKQTSETNCQ